MRELSLDRLLIVPTGLPPHKVIAERVTEEDRLAMARLAFSALPRTEVSDIEIRRGGRSYTYMTLEALSAPGRSLFFLVGTDMFLSLDAWRCPERIFSACTVVCARRENAAANDLAIAEKKTIYETKYGAEIVLMKNPVVEISSGELRRSLCDADLSDPSRYLSAEVTEYIRRHHLYVGEEQKHDGARR